MFYFNSASDKQKYPSISPKKWEELSTALEFSELAVVSSEASYRLYLVLTKDVKAMERGADDKWKDASTTDILLYMDFKRVPKTYKGKTTDPSRLEKFVCSQLENIDTTKVYKGVISLQDSPMLQMVVDGITATGQPVDAVTKTMLLGSLWSLTETEPSKIVLTDLEAPTTGKSGGGYSNSQTEVEKLNDRMAFIKAQLAITNPDLKVESIYSLTEAGMAEAGYQPMERAVLTIDACLKLMGCESWHDSAVNG